jgi:TRAP-type C4-dicarboxylate transport system permease small subunit
MFNLIEKIDRGLEKLERGLAVGLFALLISMICINVFARNVLHMASHRLLELSPSVVLWLALVGATLALKHDRHIKIELLLRFFSPHGQRLAMVVTSLFAMGVCAVLAYASVIFVYNEIMLFGPKGWAAVCFPLFFSTACFRFALRLLSPWTGTQGGRT